MIRSFASICIWAVCPFIFFGAYLIYDDYYNNNITDDMSNQIAAMNQKYYNDPAFALFLADAIKDGVIVKEEYYRLKNRARICDIISVSKEGIYAAVTVR
jgi:hypothetical protein